MKIIISKAQKKLLMVFIVVQLAIILFPPFLMHVQTVREHKGFTFIWNTPGNYESINIGLLFIECIVCWVITGALFLLFSESTKDNNQK
ncbi:MAG: hypothetical protein PHQ52_01925 [Candidatus Omnitrophica bacterium]|nr:hypothetical protein [Candidatus Omnitrophota bacterium]